MQAAPSHPPPSAIRAFQRYLVPYLAAPFVPLYCTLVHPSISMHPLRYCTLLLCPDALLSPETLVFPPFYPLTITLFK